MVGPELVGALMDVLSTSELQQMVGGSSSSGSSSNDRKQEAEASKQDYSLAGVPVWVYAGVTEQV